MLATAVTLFNELGSGLQVLVLIVGGIFVFTAGILAGELLFNLIGR